MHQPVSQNANRWLRIWIVFLTGVAAAFMVGKAPAALPVLRDELSLTLVDAGLVVSMFSLLAAGFGIFIGVLSDRFGQLKLAVCGLIVASLAGVMGGYAGSAEVLIASRVAEGVGFFMMSVSLPGLIIKLSDDKTRQTAMGLWGSYLPLGAGLLLLASSVIIANIGWRGLWFVISATYVVLLAALVWAAPKQSDQPIQQPTKRISTVLKTPGAVLLAVVFGLYSGQYLAVTSFVPLILVERAGWALAPAAKAGALVMVMNVTGNLAAGLLLDRGVKRRILLIIAAAMMGLGALIVMSEALPVWLRISGAVLFSSFGGLIPGSLFAGVPHHAPSPTHVSTVNGLMLQAVAIGQLAGPSAVTWLVSSPLMGDGQWAWSLVYLLPVAALTAMAGYWLGRIESAQG